LVGYLICPVHVPCSSMETARCPSAYSASLLKRPVSGTPPQTASAPLVPCRQKLIGTSATADRPGNSEIKELWNRVAAVWFHFSGKASPSG
jgi:hypothetical protein